MEQQKCAGVGAVCTGTCTEDLYVPTFPSLAMVYAPTQQFRFLYEENDGLRRGTIFRELDKPFEKSAVRSGCGCSISGNGGMRR